VSATATGCTCRSNRDHCPWCQALEARIAVERPAPVRPPRSQALKPKPPKRTRQPYVPLCRRRMTVEPPAETPELLTVAEVAGLLRLTENTVLRMALRDRIPRFIRFRPGLIRLRRDDLLAWIVGQFPGRCP
jgi:excisionase family DNA binding protein